MKKFLCVLLVIVVVFALAAAGGYGYAWYRNNHIFVEDAVYPIDAESLDLRGQDISVEHYLSVRSQLPECEILWDVPFQGAKYPNNTESLTVTALTEEDVRLLLDYFPSLKRLDASGCEEYLLLTSIQAEKPEWEVIYQVRLGEKAFPLDTTELVLENGDYDFTTMMENLKYLPEVSTITLKMPELSLEQVEQLKAAYEAIEVSCTVELMGKEYDTQTTELDLSSLTSADVEAVSEKLAMLPGLTAVELMDAEGISQLTKEDVKTLQTAAPDAAFHYSFDFYGVTISTTDEEVHIKNKKIGDDGEAEVRLALDLMENCSRFVLENCRISNELMAQLRDDYRDKTKVVWRISFSDGGSCLTDVEVIRTTYGLTDNNCTNLMYCEDAKYIDIGHNEFLDAVPFVAYMPNLEAIIVSGAPIKDLTPFENCKNLKFLEIAYCGYIEDLSPLAGCESLEMLNISFTKVTDLSPIEELALTHLSIVKSKVPTEDLEQYATAHPDCWIISKGDQPYGTGWRYTETGDKLPWYAKLAEAFKYPDAPNHTGWYY